MAARDQQKITRDFKGKDAQGNAISLRHSIIISKPDGTDEQVQAAEKKLEALGGIGDNEPVDAIAQKCIAAGIPYEIVAEEAPDTTSGTRVSTPGGERGGERGGEDKLTRAANAGTGLANQSGTPGNPAPGSLYAKPDAQNPKEGGQATDPTKQDDPSKAPQSQSLSGGSSGSNPTKPQ